MTTFHTFAFILCFAAVGAVVNHKYMKLPTTIGLMLIALLVSISALALSDLGLVDLRGISSFIAGVDFSGFFLHGVLAFLLFAGSLHIDLSELRKFRLIVALLATFSVVIATFVTAGLLWQTAGLFGISFPYITALLFGALIAPTDPVAVLGVLKETKLSKGLRIKIASESLFNDGVSVVVFLSLLAMANGTWLPDAAHAILFLVWGGLGSVVLGLTLGWMTLQLLGGIDDYKVEVLVTLAIVTGGYVLAEAIEVSAPITMVITGLFIGNHGQGFSTLKKNRKHLDLFWELLDEIINALLFMFLGLEMIVLAITDQRIVLGLLAIMAMLVGRFISVALPVLIMRLHYRFERGTIRLLTWGGLRGGISIAMALALPPGKQKDLVIAMTYIAVIFSILFQGTTFRYLARLIARRGGITRLYKTSGFSLETNPMKISRLLLLVPLLFAAACSTPPPPPLPVESVKGERLNLDVKEILLIDHTSEHAPVSPAVDSAFKPTLDAAIRDWAAGSLRAVGTDGRASFTINDAYVTEKTLPIDPNWYERKQATEYVAHAELSLQAEGRERFGAANATATHEVTLPEHPTPDERQIAYTRAINGVMLDLTKYIDQGIHNNLQDFVVTAPVLNGQPMASPMPESPGMSP